MSLRSHLQSRCQHQDSDYHSLLAELDELESFAKLGRNVVERAQDAAVLAPLAKALHRLRITALDDEHDAESMLGKARQALATAWIRTAGDTPSSSTVEYIGLAIYRLAMVMKRLERTS